MRISLHQQPAERVADKDERARQVRCESQIVQVGQHLRKRMRSLGRFAKAESGSVISDCTCEAPDLRPGENPAQGSCGQARLQDDRRSFITYLLKMKNSVRDVNQLTRRR